MFWDVFSPKIASQHQDYSIFTRGLAELNEQPSFSTDTGTGVASQHVSDVSAYVFLSAKHDLHLSNGQNPFKEDAITITQPFSMA